MASRYTLELQALAASLTTPAGPTSDQGPSLLVLDQAAAKLLLAFEQDLEPRLAAGSGDLAHLAGWAAKLAKTSPRSRSVANSWSIWARMRSTGDTRAGTGVGLPFELVALLGAYARPTFPPLPGRHLHRWSKPDHD